jgi:5'-3' exonuclease
MATTLSEHVKTFTPSRYGNTKPSLPFQQLLSVLPPKSSNLLPFPLNKCLENKQSKMAQFCPDEIIIDLSGKRREWEGITIIPIVDQKIVREMYKKHVNLISQQDLDRNVSNTPKQY